MVFLTENETLNNFSFDFMLHICEHYQLLCSVRVLQLILSLCECILNKPLYFCCSIFSFFVVPNLKTNCVFSIKSDCDRQYNRQRTKL